jgi:hypothetical protein
MVERPFFEYFPITCNRNFSFLEVVVVGFLYFLSAKIRGVRAKLMIGLNLIH